MLYICVTLACNDYKRKLDRIIEASEYTFSDIGSNASLYIYRIYLEIDRRSDLK